MNEYLCNSNHGKCYAGEAFGDPHASCRGGAEGGGETKSGRSRNAPLKKQQIEPKSEGRKEVK